MPLTQQLTQHARIVPVHPVQAVNRGILNLYVVDRDRGMLVRLSQQSFEPDPVALGMQAHDSGPAIGQIAEQFDQPAANQINTVDRIAFAIDDILCHEAFAFALFPYGREPG